jgi:hypothetical protein
MVETGHGVDTLNQQLSTLQFGSLKIGSLSASPSRKSKVLLEYITSWAILGSLIL